MTDDRAHTGEPTPEDVPETPIPAPKPNESGQGVDDHVVTPYPRGLGHQPTDTLDEGVDDEHLSSPSQGVKPEPIPERDVGSGS
jgi:hypothetical protein